VLVGDTAGFLNSARLKGVHLANQSGLMAGEAIADALERNDTTAQSLAKYTEIFENSWRRRALAVRNFHQAFHSGFFTGLTTRVCSSSPETRPRRASSRRVPNHESNVRSIQVT